MKRKLIQELAELSNAELKSRASLMFPGDEPAAPAARQLLIDAIAACRKSGEVDPRSFFDAVRSAPERLVEFVKGSRTSKLERVLLAQAQGLVGEALTSKAGRKRTSDLSRQEQFAAGASRYRAKLKGESKKRVDVWICPEAAEYLDHLKTVHSFASQAEALELVLLSVKRGKLPKPR